MSDQRLKIAVFIDFDNVEIGVKTTLGLPFDIGAVLEAIKERGEIITKVAYGDWKRSGDYGRAMAQHAVRLVQRVPTPGGDKNGADIKLCLDATEDISRFAHIGTVIIVGGDSDFMPVAQKIKAAGRTAGVSLLLTEPLELLEPHWHELDILTVVGTAMGIKGASMVQVLGGLNEGDQVVIGDEPGAPRAAKPTKPRVAKVN